MKKIILLFLFTTFSFAQDNVTTTIDEYNYMKNGYYVAQKNGLDLKQGYTIKDLVVHEYADYKFDYKTLIRDSDNKCVGILLNATSKLWLKNYHFAMPFNNNDLLSDYVKDLNTWDKSMLGAYTQSSSILFSAFSSITYNHE